MTKYTLSDAEFDRLWEMGNHQTLRIVLKDCEGNGTLWAAVSQGQAERVKQILNEEPAVSEKRTRECGAPWRCDKCGQQNAKYALYCGRCEQGDEKEPPATKVIGDMTEEEFDRAWHSIRESDSKSNWAELNRITKDRTLEAADPAPPPPNETTTKGPFYRIEDFVKPRKSWLRRLPWWPNADGPGLCLAFATFAAIAGVLYLAWWTEQ